MSEEVASSRRRITPETPLDFPGIIVVDTREQNPYRFDGLRANSDKLNRPLAVRTKVDGLQSGDYSIEGMETEVAIERKSLEDLFSTLSHGRQRFERELQRLTAYNFAAVVVEADWGTILRHPPDRSQMLPKSVIRSVIAYQIRYPGIQWWACPDRAFAESVTFRLLERYLKDVTDARTQAVSFSVWLGRKRGEAGMREGGEDFIDI